jgi:dTMP kinase
VLDRFVVLEGLDGAGTTTQLQLAAEKLEKSGRPSFCTSEPTSGPIGRQVRDVLTRRLRVQPRTLALLFAADRTEHLTEPRTGMLSRLERGELVVCDRYLFSSLAYQSLDCDFDFVLALNREFPLPRHVVFLDTPVPESQRRLAARSGSRPELFDGEDLQERIRANYHKAFELFRPAGLQLHVLDGTLPQESLFGKFWKILESVPML